jgi:ArsR family transcriptional regulator, arsenate/arsenite/antimonite-responsive transcriptional repressor
MTKRQMKRFIDITAALADENRVRALLSLRRGELCMCQITEMLGLAPSTVSKHLSLLKQAGLVEARKDGRWMYFRIADDETTAPEAHAALQWAIASLARDPRIIEDGRRIKAICREDPAEICRRQCNNRKDDKSENDADECCSSAPATPAAARWPKASRAASKAT